MFLNPNIVKEVKIDKSLDKLFRGFCLWIRKFSEESNKQPFTLVIEFLKQKEEEAAAGDFKWDKQEKGVYITYEDFKIIVDEFYSLSLEEKDWPEERKIKALFSLFDTLSCKTVS